MLIELIAAIRRWLREWREAIRSVDEGGDANDASK